MRVSVCLGAIPIPEYLDFHSGYSAPGSRIAGIYSGTYSYSGISQTNAPLNSSVYHRNIFGSSSKVFGHLRTSSEIFGKCRGRSSGLRNNFGKSSEIFGEWSEIFGKSSKRLYQYVYIIKRTLHVSSKIWILCYSWQEKYLLFLPLEHKIHIFSPPCNILYLFSSIYSCYPS